MRVVVSGPWAGDTEIWRLPGEERLNPEAEPGMLSTGGKAPSDTADDSGTLTVFTSWVEEVEGVEEVEESSGPG